MSVWAGRRTATATYLAVREVRARPRSDRNKKGKHSGGSGGVEAGEKGRNVAVFGCGVRRSFFLFPGPPTSYYR